MCNDRHPYTSLIHSKITGHFELNNQLKKSYFTSHQVIYKDILLLLGLGQAVLSTFPSLFKLKQK